MRGRSLAALAILMALSMILPACRLGKMDLPGEPDFAGVTLSVWDLSQPKVEGAPDYQTEAQRVAREFAAHYGVEVDLRFALRQEIADLLAGKAVDESPALVFTGEWPSVPDAAWDLSSSVSETDYVDAAAFYWQKDGRLLAVPAYVQWLGVASRDSGTKDVFFADSPAFLRAALESQGAPWDPDAIFAYLTWVEQQWGRAESDPLRAWQEGIARSLYPVTPYLFEWLASTEASEVSLEPIPGPFADPCFFYTVPGYVVLARDGAQRECAARLAFALAANLGRWAARAVGCVPALRADVSVFNLESGFSFEDRSSILSSLTEPRFSAPLTADTLLQESLQAALRQVAVDYLSGRTTAAEARSSIQETMQRHTKP